VSRIYFYAGVFAFFSSIGFISLLMQTVQLPLTQILITVLVMGIFAIGYAAVSIARRHWIIPLLILAEAAFFGFLKNLYREPLQFVERASPFRDQLAYLGVGAILSVVAGYFLFISFFRQQGARYFRAQNEIALASEIHKALVPPIQKTLGSFEVFATSVPSGEVGGDLVDIAGDGNSWTGYVADVSGHGVSAGLLMAMFKTAVRTRASQTSPECLLNDVHRALYPLKTPNMFATVGVLQWTTGNQFSLALAGHPPLLHFSKRAGEVREYPTLDLPLGILPEQTFSSTSVTCEAGDILLLLTDGMTEVFDKHGNEMGIEPIKSALAKSATLPLAEIFAKLRQVALGAGPQDDDQTMLIVRRAL
jgi:serine phosphatase RsbU (regulator of sigma subunit)